MTDRKLVVGLTGSFGSGKSTVGRMFKRLGAKKVIDCDRLAHEVFRPGHRLAERIKSLFHRAGSMSRNAIAREVFSDPGKRKRLEAIVHPYVGQRIRSELKKVRSGIVILEVPLLFETGFDRSCDATVVVLAGESNIIKRLSRNGFEPEEVRGRLRAQLPEREKRRRADFLILNSGSKRTLAKNVKSVWQELNLKN